MAAIARLPHRPPPSSSSHLLPSLTHPSRPFHTTPSARAGGKTKIRALKSKSSQHRLGGPSNSEMFDMNADLEPFLGDDVPSAVHRMWGEARERLRGLRLIKYQMPGLQRFRQPFVPPPSDASILVQTHDELFPTLGKHPSQTPSSLVSIRLPLSRLPSSILSSPEKLHKFKVLAGERWRAAEGGEGEGGEGVFVLKGERYASRRENEKWVSDTLDRLLAAASDLSDPLSDVPTSTSTTSPSSHHRRQRRPHYNKHDLPAHPFPIEWYAPETRRTVIERKERAEGRRQGRLKEREEVNGEMRARLGGWDGIGIAPPGTFERTEEGGSTLAGRIEGGSASGSASEVSP